MQIVDRKPTRAQLRAFLKEDQQAILAFEKLFSAKTLIPGDVIYAAALTRTGALPTDGAAVSRTLYQDLYNAIVPSTAVTITIAAPGVVSWTANGLAANTKISFVTSGALPTGLVAGTVYFVKTAGTNSFTVSATAGGAAITTTGTQSGTHTATAYPYGNGDGTTTFNVPTVTAVGGTNGFIIY